LFTVVSELIGYWLTILIGTGLRTPWARQMRNGLRRTPREGRGEHLFGINDNSRRSALTPPDHAAAC